MLLFAASATNSLFQSGEYTFVIVSILHKAT